MSKLIPISTSPQQTSADRNPMVSIAALALWRWQTLAACLLLIAGLVFAACSSGPSPAPPLRHVTPVPTPQLGRQGCHPPSPLDTSNLGFPEARGTTPARDLWALFLGGVPQAGQPGKIIWKMGMSFDEPVQIFALGPHGQHLRPLFLQRHAASTWNRPGAEWGTGFTFPSSGCWDLHVTDGKTVGDVYVIIS